MANVVNIEAHGEGLEVVVTVDFDDGTVKQMVARVWPPPCDCPPALTRADILQMIEAHSCSGVA
jgi:hypothetical protein